MNSNNDEKSRKKLGETLKKAREKENFTQAEVAQKADITVNYYAMIERGEVNATVDILKRIIKVLRIKSFDLVSF